MEPADVQVWNQQTCGLTAGWLTQGLDEASMGKASRTKVDTSRRERIAAQRAAERRAEQRRRILIASGSIVVVIAVVVGFIVFKATSKPGSSTSSNGPTGAALSSVVSNVTSVPASTLDKVGNGSGQVTANPPVKAITGGTPLTANGKPEVLYIGAEFCPYCAAMRWSLAVALSKFGTFSTPLRGIHSAPDEAPSIASLPTLTFYRSAYQSPYLTFTPVENEKIDHSPLQATTPLQQQVWDRYDPNSYPFIDIGNRYVVTIIYDARVLHGKTWGQVAAALHDPASPIARGAIGAANYLIAAICHLTGSKPTGVCSSPTISALH